MAFFKKLLGVSSRPRDHFKEFIPAIEEMIQEADRVHRILVTHYCRDLRLGMFSGDYSPAFPTGKGLYKARLLASQFLPQALIRRTSPSQISEVVQLCNIASGLALRDLLEPSASPAFSLEEAKVFGFEYAKQVMRAIIDEFQSGPSTPVDQTEGFQCLVELSHESLRDSIGLANYSDEVKERFYYMIGGGINAALLHTTKWM